MHCSTPFDILQQFPILRNMWKELIFPSHINLTETEKGLKNPLKSGFPVQMLFLQISFLLIYKK